MRFLSLLLVSVLFFTCDPGRGSEDIGDAQADGDTPYSMGDADNAPDDVDDLTLADNATGAGTTEILNEVRVNPIFHAGTVLRYAGQTVFVDPYEKPKAFKKYGNPDMVLITHTHPDHMDFSTLGELELGLTTLIAPQLVADAIEGKVAFRDVVVLGNGEVHEHQNWNIMAVPAYNDASEPGKVFHPKGDFNGYVISIADETLYFAGDTGNVPTIEGDMDIDYAFVPVNQPYTMTIEEAVKFITDVGPTVVYPYHYRNQDGSLTDLSELEEMLRAAGSPAEVKLLDWYAGMDSK